MAGFAERLWESIFTPGPTPTLLVATNVTFAALQLVLLILLVATWSVHFVVLSFLSAGLWWAINWFANELQAAQEKETREKARAGERAARHATSDSETEVETVVKTKKPAANSSQFEAMEEVGDLKLRDEQSSGTKSSVSTEDEWEKVSENEKDK
ncbi:Pkr1-domain-containing protein [Xylariaceae sp. FL0016]|nr:Pkr1-domain-containing protein [Xylariaceae sp. FL0016]